MDKINRRLMLGGLGMAGAGLAGAARAQSTGQGNRVYANAAPTVPDPSATHRLRFAVIGLDHLHVYAMTDALIRGGGALVAVHASDPRQLAPYLARYGDVKVARTEAEILDDYSVQVVASASIPLGECPFTGRRTEPVGTLSGKV